MAVDVAAHAGLAQQVQIIGARKKSDVIDLRNSRCKQLQRASDQVFVLSPAEGVEVGAVHLIQIQVVCRRSRRLPALHPCFARESSRPECRFPPKSTVPEEPALLRSGPTSITPIPSCVSSTVMQFRGRWSSQCFKRAAFRVYKRVQHQRRQREVIHPVDMPRDVDLVLVVGVNLDQHFDAQRVRLEVSPAMKSKVSGIMKQLVPGFLMAYPAASRRIARTPEA